MVENKVKKGDIVALKVKRAGATFVNFQRYAGYVEYVLAKVEAATREGALKQARTASHVFRKGDWTECLTLGTRQADARLIFDINPEPWNSVEDLKAAFTCQHTDFNEEQDGAIQCRRCKLKIPGQVEPAS